jgi:hypothetical protein
MWTLFGRAHDRVDGGVQMKVTIRLGEALGPRYARAFADLTIRNETVLMGEVADDAALHGLLARLRDLDIAMLDVRVEGRENLPVPTPPDR